MREVLDEEGFLSDVNIQIKKRVVPRIKGLRLLNSTLRTTVERHTQQQQAIGAIQELERSKSECGCSGEGERGGFSEGKGERAG